MKCMICNHELGRQIRSIPITMLGSTTDEKVCPVCYDVLQKLRQPTVYMFQAGPDIYLSGKPVESLEVVFDDHA